MSNKDEGVIKYSIEWIETSAYTSFDYSNIENARMVMFDKAWIGFDEKYNVGYGNISEKIKDKQFIISGTQTGHLNTLSPNEYVRVSRYDIDANSLECIGPIKASSESLTHAAIYEKDPSAKCIVHIHDNNYWLKTLEQKNVPITHKDIPYGTPEMAYEIYRLFEEENLANIKILSMAGHEGGIISFGKTFNEAIEVLEKYCL